jgi:anti-sigma B factor antagonist
VTDEDGTVWHLHVTEENIGEVLVLVVAGRISNATAGDLGRALARPDKSCLRGIIVDLSAVDYVNSAGLQQLETAGAQMQGSRCELVVCGLRPVVNAVFQLAGSIPHLTIESSREAAIARLGGQHVPTRNKEMKPFAL